MNLTKLKEAYPKFLLLLKDKRYKVTTIEMYQWVINRLLSEAQVSDIHSFEDYFVLLKGKLSAKSLPECGTDSMEGMQLHMTCVTIMQLQTSTTGRATVTPLTRTLFILAEVWAMPIWMIQCIITATLQRWLRV